MRQVVLDSPCLPFFLPGQHGQRFCMYIPPAGTRARANVLHVPAFAEEMNKARRMVALQARALAKLGIGVLLVDLYGSGDSGGDFADARWDLWKKDLADAVTWLRRRDEAPVVLWGLRAGALLMMDYAHGSGEEFESFVLWQPVVSGEAYLTQFLRLRVANEMMAGDKAKAGTRELRAALKAGESLEIAGYQLSPSLAMALDECRLARMAIPDTACHWLEVAAGDAGTVTPAGRRVLDEWVERGVKADARVVTGEPFWATQETTECRPLLEATCRLFASVTQ